MTKVNFQSQDRTVGTQVPMAPGNPRAWRSLVVKYFQITMPVTFRVFDGRRQPGMYLFSKYNQIFSIFKTNQDP